MSTKKKGKKETKQESPTQYKVVNPISLTDLEHIHTRKGKYPTRPPPFGQPTWEEAKRGKEEKLKKLRRERSPSTPLKTTSTEAMDTEEAQEFGKKIVAKATQRELRKQEYIRYQQRRQQAVEYDFPKPGTIPIPQLEKPRDKREARPQSVLSNFEVPNYEEISMYSGKTQKYFLQYNDISNRLHGQFEVVTSMLGLPFKETLDTYPSLDSIMRVVEQEDLRGKGESFFEELMGEIEIKNAIAAKVYQTKSLEVTNSKEETGITREFEEYKKGSGKLMDFCKRMIDKRDKREEYEELEQPQGVPDVKPISKRELDEKIKEALIIPKMAQNIGENTIPPQYSREISRYEPPIPVREKEKEDLLEKVREITSGESKGSKDEKQAEGETELSWDHEGLEPYPSQRDLNHKEIPKERRLQKKM